MLFLFIVPFREERAQENEPDTIHLKTGQTIKGKILDDSGAIIKLRLPDGRIQWIHHRRIQRIDKVATPAAKTEEDKQPKKVDEPVREVRAPVSREKTPERKTGPPAGSSEHNQAAGHHEKKMKTEPYRGKFGDTVYKLEGVIFAGYEFNDHNTNGEPDASGAAHEDTGFAFHRFYITFKGETVEGPLKGWSYRISTDVVRAGEEGDGCGDTCSKHNDYGLVLKYGYVSVPLPLLPRTYIRLGQSHVPTVDAQARLSLEHIWGYRYVTYTTWEDIGFSHSTDLGVALLHDSDYFALHLHLGNGEGWHFNNAHNLKNGTLQDLAYGNGDSYALNFAGLISFIPTGRNKEWQWSVNFPFLLNAVEGIDRSEWQVLTADVTDINNPQFVYLVGDARAKRDYAYGWETDLVYEGTTLHATIGGGMALKVDRRSTARLYDENGVNPLDLSEAMDQTYVAQDSRATASYIFAHFKVGRFGAFARLTVGTNDYDRTQGPSRKVTAPDGRDWWRQMLTLDARNGELGDLTVSEMQNGIDFGLGRLNNLVLGVTFYPTSNIDVSLGMIHYTGRDKTGKTFRVNRLERIGPQGAATGSVSEQLEDSTQLKQAIGYQPDDELNLNDFIGTQNVEEQVFIRTQMKF